MHWPRCVALVAAVLSVVGCAKKSGEGGAAESYDEACELAEEVVSDRSLTLEKRIALLEERARAGGLSRPMRELIDAAEGDDDAKDVSACAALVRMVEMRRSGEDDMSVQEGDALRDLKMICAKFERFAERGGSLAEVARAIKEELRTKEGHNIFDAMGRAAEDERASIFEQGAKELGAPDLTCPAIEAFHQRTGGR